MTNQITCPKCHTTIDVEKVLADQISVNLEQAYFQKKKELDLEFQNKQKQVEQAQEEIKRDKSYLMKQ